jgi:hypothetical protein
MLSYIYTGFVASEWLSKWGTTTGCMTSLMYWSPVRLPCMVTKSSLQSWEIHPKPLLSLHRKGQLARCSLGHRLHLCVSKPASDRRLHEAETGSRLTNGSCAMSLNSNHVGLNTMPSMSFCQQWTFNDSPWLKSRWFQTVSNCSCWQTSNGQPVLFEYCTGCECHPSNQTLQCPVVTIRCFPWSAGSWHVFHIVGLCVFSHQSADYSIAIFVLVIFAFVPWLLRINTFF